VIRGDLPKNLLAFQPCLFRWVPGHHVAEHAAFWPASVLGECQSGSSKRLDVNLPLSGLKIWLGFHYEGEFIIFDPILFLTIRGIAVPI
jgi:hypothetical protein